MFIKHIRFSSHILYAWYAGIALSRETYIIPYSYYNNNKLHHYFVFGYHLNVPTDYL